MRREQNTDFKFNSFFFYMESVEFSSQTCWQPQTRDRALDNNPTCVGRWQRVAGTDFVYL